MKLRSRGALVARLVLAAAAVQGGSALAQLPPPPVSPAPVADLEYDAQGNPTKTSRAGLATVSRYDSLSRRFKITDARNKDTLLEHNGRDDLTQVTDPRGLVTTYPRNGLGDLTGLTSPDTGSATHTLDAAGNLKTRTDSRGVLATYDYDALNRLSAVTYTQSNQSAQSFQWFYDQTGPGFSHGVGRLTTTQFPTGATTYAYDPQGRLLSATQTVTADNTVRLTVNYGYDAAGQLTSITYPSGRVVSIARTGGLPTSLSLTPANSSSAIGLMSSLVFQPDPGSMGPLRSWSWELDSGALAQERVFDIYGRLVRYPLGGAVRDLTYDAADRIQAYTHYDAISGAPVASLDQGFGYDELDRLISVNSATYTAALGYDDNGNRIWSVTASGAGSSTRNYTVAPDSNRLLSLDNPTRALQYDEAGSLRDERQGNAHLTYTIDLSGRIAGVSGTLDGIRTVTASYGYDNAGLRVVKKLLLDRACPPSPTRTNCTGGALPPGTGVVYAYDPQGHLLGEYSLATGAVMREYVWLGDTPVAVVDGTPAAPVIAYIQVDHLDTPRTVIDRAGRQRWTWLAEPFGNSRPVDNPVGFGAFTLNLRMPGQYFDSESGLAYNWNRNYDAGIGRYTQSDPIGLAGGINTYAYVGAQPTRFVDPMGLLSSDQHNAITIEALWRCGIDPALLRKLAWATAAADWTPSWNESQSVMNPHWHAMRGLETPELARAATEKFIREQMASGTIEGMGRAIHAAQDSAAGGHEGYQRYTGRFDLWHFLKDVFPSQEERRRAIERTRALFEECECKR